MSPAILWFRRNLRIIDNDALIVAADSGQPIVAVYVSDDLDTGGASRWWLHHSLQALSKSIEDLGGSLVIRRGEPEDVISALVAETGASALYCAARYEPEARRQQKKIRAKLGKDFAIEAVHDGVMQHPSTVLTKSGSPYKVFTPYWRAASALADPATPRPAPDAVEFLDHDLDSLSVDQLELPPTAPDWSGGMTETWTPGEAGALARIDALSKSAPHYDKRRDRPDMEATSRLSPHLHFGEVSVRQVWHAIKDVERKSPTSSGTDALSRQLFWRDFSTYLLYHFPGLPDTPLRPEFEAFPWQQDAEMLRAWQKGMTGFPIVDAGMRQLWHTGWMHNRVRMIVASFLVKELLIPWQQGAAWFADTLVDHDLANNSASWQWVAGCGTDSAPYFRIFNPTLQGQKFDPNGDYVRRWVPELAKLDRRVIHEPWQASYGEQKAAGVVVGKDYPSPIVDRSIARERALEAYHSLRGDEQRKSA